MKPRGNIDFFISLLVDIGNVIPTRGPAPRTGGEGEGEGEDGGGRGKEGGRVVGEGQRGMKGVQVGEGKGGEKKKCWERGMREERWVGEGEGERYGRREG